MNEVGWRDAFHSISYYAEEKAGIKWGILGQAKSDRASPS